MEQKLILPDKGRVSSRYFLMTADNLVANSLAHFERTSRASDGDAARLYGRPRFRKYLLGDQTLRRQHTAGGRWLLRTSSTN